MAPVVASGQKTPDKAQREGGWGRAGQRRSRPFPLDSAAGRQKHNYPFLPLRFSVLWGFHIDVSDVLSLGTDMPSSGGEFWGWCPSELQGRGLPGDRHKFWGWCPLKLKEPLQCGRPEGELFRRYSLVDSHDLRHNATPDRDTSSDP